MQDIGPSMRQTMPAAAALLAQNNVERIGAPGAIYNAVDIKNQTCRYTAYMPVAAGIQVDGAVSGSVPAGRALKLVHTGSYENLGNAWSCAMAYSRHNKIKLRKGISGLEQYVNDSETTPPADLITELYLPLR